MPPKGHLLLPRTVQISIACFLHVDDGNVFVVVFILLLLFVCFFPRGRDPRALPAAMVSYVRGKMAPFLWRSGRVSLSDHSTDESRSAAGCQGRLRDALRERARACGSHRAAATMGHGPFHCIAPPLTSLAAVTNTLAPPLCRSLHHSTTTHLR